LNFNLIYCKVTRSLYWAVLPGALVISQFNTKRSVGERSSLQQTEPVVRGDKVTVSQIACLVCDRRTDIQLS